MTTAVAAVVLGGYAGPLVLLVGAVITPAVGARVLGSLLRASVLLAMPIAVSALTVNLFFYPGGGSELLRLGPIVASAEGLAFGLEIVLRIVTISGAVTLLYLTTPGADLVVDLERRGVSPRVAFVANASLQTVPAMVERAAEINDAQRARGLDTEGSVWRRARGVVPIVGPVLLGAIAEVEQRALALEARAFTRPGRRTLLWAPADRRAEAIARWVVVAAVAVMIALRIAGRLP